MAEEASSTLEAVDILGLMKLLPHRYPFLMIPGVLIVEAMAQTAVAICIRAAGVGKPSLVYFLTIDGAKFRKPVVPGDQLRIHVKKLKKRGNLLKFACEAMVDGSKVAEAEIQAMMVDNG